MNASSDPPDAVSRIGLIAAALPLVVTGSGGDYEYPDPLHFAMLAAGIAGITGALVRARWAGSFVLLAGLAFGVYLRVQVGDNRASDVMLATNEALSTLANGGNPYAHFYQMTNPPGGLFGYPPGELAFYGLARLLGANVYRVDIVAGIAILVLVASLAPLIGDGLAALAVATMSTAGELIFHSNDGSNDTAASFLTVLAVVALSWSLATRGRSAQTLWFASAVAFGWVIAFKEYALPIAFFVALFLWRADASRTRRWIAVAAGTTLAFVLPFFVWNPIAFVTNVGGALVVHHNIWGRNLWHDALIFMPGASALTPVIPALAIFACAGLALALWRRPAPNLGAACLQGCALVALVFVSARWTTSVYYVFLAPVVLAGVALMLGGERAARPAAPPQR